MSTDTTEQAPPLVDPATAVLGFAAWLTGRRDALTISAEHDAAIVAELVDTFRQSQGWAEPPEDFTTQLRPYPSEEPGPTFDQILAAREIGTPIIKFFRFGHLPSQLQGRSRPWAELALRVVDDGPPSAERTTALRKLLEGKDCAVRAAL